ARMQAVRATSLAIDQAVTFQDPDRLAQHLPADMVPLTELILGANTRRASDTSAMQFEGELTRQRMRASLRDLMLRAAQAAKPDLGLRPRAILDGIKAGAEQIGHGMI